MSYADDSWQGKDPGRRTINFICSQQVKSEWQDHPVSLVFTSSKQKGWQITGESSGGKSPAEADADGKENPAARGQGKGQPSPLHLAASLSPLSPDNEAYALQLVREGADVNLRDEFGNTPLHILCYGCLSPRLVQALLAAGADVHLKTREGQTALDLINMMAKSGQGGSCDTIRAQLLKAGAR